MVKKVKKEGDQDPIVKHWLAEIEASRKRDKDFRSDGKRIRSIYAGDKKDATPFNILYSNIETIAPSLYSQVPRPVVQYRFKDGNPIGKAAASASQRILEFMLDTNVDGYETFDDTMKAVVTDGLLPGRGNAHLKYDAEENGEVKISELVCSESDSWDRVYYGYAKKWSRVPWVAYELQVDKEEAEKLFPDAVSKIEFTKGEQDDDDGRKKGDESYTGERKTALVYKIWDKKDRKVRFISPQYSDGYLNVIDDPLGLSGFFDCPRPLQFVEKTDDMVPTAMYTLYETQAQELNALSVRINRIIKAIRAKALYDGKLGDDLGNLMEADEGSMTATESDVLSIEKGMDKGIWFWPVDKLIIVLRELYTAREACKQVIYEVTGISDIVRGASKASETLGAQQIKAQWGTLRIKPKQYEVQRYARDMLRMMIEIAANKFSQDTWAKMTGLPYLTDMQVEQTTKLLQATQQAMQAVPPPMPGQPPDPNIQQAQQAMQQAQAELQKPHWADVIKSLQDDVQRAYNIDIETNSTIEPEAAEDQKNIAELMTAIGQFLNGVGPMVQAGVMPFQVAQGMLLAITKRFRFGDEIEDIIKQMKPPPPQDNGEAQKAQKAEQAAAQATQQAESMKQQAQQKAGQDAATIQQLQTQIKQKDAETAIKDRETKLALDRQDLEAEKAIFKLEQQRAQESLKNSAEKEGSKLDTKKQMLGMEQKQAKSEQQANKQSESKIVAPLQDVQSQIKEIVAVNKQQATEISELKKMVSAPRKRTAVRGKDGRIESSIDEVMQ